MPDNDAVSIVADTLRTHQFSRTEHQRNPSRTVDFCNCGWRSTFEHRTHAAHVAAAVVDALGGLGREWGSQMLGDDEITIGSEGTARFCAQQHPLTWTALSRWVSGWVREPAEENRDA